MDAIGTGAEHAVETNGSGGHGSRLSGNGDEAAHEGRHSSTGHAPGNGNDVRDPGDPYASLRHRNENAFTRQ
jgi:hypothetical protein